MLTRYEAWYRNGGLDTYAWVFRHYDEKAVEVESVATRIEPRLPWQGGVVSVLDIGCGTGLFTVMLLDRLSNNSENEKCCYEVDLVDINPEAFKRFKESASGTEKACISARKTVTALWRSVEIYDLLPPYDLIIADHVFYGEPMKNNLLDKLQKLLSPDGLAIVSLETKDADLYQMRERAGIATNMAEDFEALLQHSNTSVESLTYESRLYFDFQHSEFLEWFFATSPIDKSEQEHLLKSFSRKDNKGNLYLMNRAKMFLIRRGE